MQFDFLATTFARSLASPLQLQPPSITVVGANMVCLATSPAAGSYSFTSVVIHYMCSGGSCPSGEARAIIILPPTFLLGIC